MGILYIVSTPIGNLEDISIRAIKTLFSVDVIACEDTRRTGLLLQELKKRYSVIALHPSGVIDLHPSNTDGPKPLPASPQDMGRSDAPKLISYYDGVEQNKAPEIIQLLETGKSVALVSDAGTPLINDPGYVLVSEARKRDIPVVSVPGPSAVLAAITSSGIPADKFMYLGYPPEKKSRRIKLFTDLLQINRLICSTYVMYCAPHKLSETLKDMLEALGDREIVLCRELTKMHEQVIHALISDSIRTSGSMKGEIVIVFRL